VACCAARERLRAKYSAAVSVWRRRKSRKSSFSCQKARARSPDAVAEEAAIGEVGALNMLIAEAAERLDAGGEVMLQGTHGDHDIDDRLRAQARHRRAANMLDGDDALTQGVQNTVFLVFIALGPVGIILGENDCCAHRLPPFQQSSSTS
jgi:hypothetical protein